MLVHQRVSSFPFWKWPVTSPIPRVPPWNSFRSSSHLTGAHGSRKIPRKSNPHRSPALGERRWTSNLFEPESVLFTQVIFVHVSTCFNMFQHVSTCFNTAIFGARSCHWDLPNEIMGLGKQHTFTDILYIYIRIYIYICIYIYITYIYVYNDSWCSHKLGRFSNKLERLHKSGSEALQPSLSESIRL